MTAELQLPNQHRPGKINVAKRGTETNSSPASTSEAAAPATALLGPMLLKIGVVDGTVDYVPNVVRTF